MKRILVVDDEEGIRSLAQRILERFGYAVETASNGQEALSLYREDAPDLVLLDMFMPDSDGFEAIRELKKEFPEARIIATSGGGTLMKKDVLEMAKVVGAAATLPKPFSLAELQSTVERVLASPS
jgi:two-component system response regulator (stage 0 sporulation protein F)